MSWFVGAILSWRDMAVRSFHSLGFAVLIAQKDYLKILSDADDSRRLGQAHDNVRPHSSNR